jgi:preprotein translocase subunit Sec61beta
MAAIYTVNADWQADRFKPIEETTMITSHRPHHQPHINPVLLITLGMVIIVLFAVITSVEAPVTTLGSEQGFTESQVRVAVPALAGDAIPAYRQSEWGAAVVPMTGASGMAQYQLSERTMIPANAGLSQYKASERTYISYVSGFAQYQASERTYVPYVSGLDQYYESERAQVVIRLDPRDPLYRYHLSEWFGR